MATSRSAPVDGFSLTYDDAGDGPPIVLLHGWPGDRGDYRDLVPLLTDRARVIVPDLRGFGASDKHDADPAEQYSAAAQARSVTGLIDELGLGPVVLGGYDVGSRLAQTIAAARPDLVRAMVLAPPMPGMGRRVLDPDHAPEFWYQSFHDLDLAVQLVDGNPDNVRAYLTHFWRHWSGPDFVLAADDLERLVANYSPPGAFRASINWYRGGGGTLRVAPAQTPPDPADRIAVPLTVLWPEHDPLFPRAWSDHLEEYFTDVAIHHVDGVGHYAPLEYPAVMAEHLLATLA